VFIFATLKIWKHRDSISKTVNTAKQKYTWKDIRIMDVCEIARWLDACPSVSIWLSKIIDNHISGIRSAEDYWNDYSDTKPKLIPNCLLVGRNEQNDKLSGWLISPQRYMIVKAESSLESILFILSSVFNMEERHKMLLSRIIIVEDKAA